MTLLLTFVVGYTGFPRWINEVKLASNDVKTVFSNDLFVVDNQLLVIICVLQ